MRAALFASVVGLTALFFNSSPCQADNPVPSAQILAGEPDGGWLVEYVVSCTGPFSATAADGADHPLQRVLQAAQDWARRELGDEPGRPAWHWYSSRNGVGVLADADHAPGTLGLEIVQAGIVYTPDGGLLEAPLPAATPMQVRIDLTLAQGTAAQSASLNAVLGSIPGVSLVGDWPLRNYFLTRYPELATPLNVVINGQGLQWPAAFTPDEVEALKWLLPVRNYGTTGHHWYGDIYLYGDSVPRLARFPLGGYARLSARLGSITLTSLPAPAGLAAIPAASWLQGGQLTVDAEEAGLPFNPVELLRASAAQALDYAVQPLQHYNTMNAAGYRATVDLPADGAAQRLQELDRLAAAWSAQYPEFAGGGKAAGLFKTGAVAPAGPPAQWQATLWSRSPELAAALADFLQAHGVTLASYSPVMATTADLPPQPPSSAARRSDKYPWVLSYPLVPADPHGRDATMAFFQLGEAGAARSRDLRDKLRTAFGAWLQAQGLTGEELSTRLNEQYFDTQDEHGLVTTAVLRLASKDDADRVRAALTLPGLPKSDPATPANYSNSPSPDGGSLQWTLIPVEAFRGVPVNAAASIDPALGSQAHAQAEGIQQALAELLPPQAGSQPRFRYFELKFGPLVRTVSVGTDVEDAGALEQLGETIRSRVPGLGPAKASPPWNPPAFESGDPQYDALRDNLIKIDLIPWERTMAFDPDEIPLLFTPEEQSAMADQARRIKEAVATWNARQLEADRVRVEEEAYGGVVRSLSLHGPRPEPQRILALGQVVDLPGVPTYKYGSALTFQRHAGRTPVRVVASTALYYKTVPSVFWQYDNLDRREELLRAHYSAEQWQALQALDGVFTAAVKAWVATQSQLYFDERGNRWQTSTGSVFISRLKAGEAPLALQVRLALDDEAQRAALVQALQSYLAAAVPGLPAPDTSGAGIS